jgi:hypothetical protein
MSLNIKTLLALLLATVSWQARACDFPPKDLLQEPLARFHGLYSNNAWGYSVVIPRSFTGYDDPDAPNHHGVGVIFDGQHPGYVKIYAEANSLEIARPVDLAAQELEYMRSQGKNIESSKITHARLGELSAVRLVVTYTCPTSPKRYMRVSILALGPGKSPVYEVTLYTSADDYTQNLPVMDQIARSWKYTGY